jgi:hypothetical protein
VTGVSHELRFERVFDTSVEITLDERDGKTLMTLVERGFPSAKVRDLHEAGMPYAFERVGRFVYARLSDERRSP